MTHAHSVFEAPRPKLLEGSSRIDTRAIWHDITEAGKNAAIKLPMVLSSDLWERVTRGEPFHPSDFRLTEMAWFLRFALLRAGHARLPSRPFLWTFLFGTAFDTTTGPSRCTVRAIILPGERESASVMLMLP